MSRLFMPECYLSMARNHLDKVLEPGNQGIKVYLYTLRSILCCKWIRMFGNQPPMLIDELLAVFLPDRENEIRRHIDNIIEIKKNRMELDVMDRSVILENYMISQLSELTNFLPRKSEKVTTAAVDDLFIKILEMLS